MKDFSKEITAYALQNAIEFGKTDAGKILPKLFQHGLDKKDIGAIMPKIQEIVKNINGMNAAAREAEFAKLEGIVKERETHEGELPELEGAVMGRVVTRLAPEPSKYNHIGHALVFLIQYFYAQKYKGKCILRIEDTNPEKSTTEFYKSMKEDLAWIGLKWDKEIIASNDLPMFYRYAEQLIVQSDAYVCSCSQEQMKALREKMEGCPCREKDAQEHMKEWKLMLKKKFKEGERTVRLKGDMSSNNGVMRDPVIFRISYASHFLQKKKYCVWPTYDFENPIEDALNGVTHVIRSAEFELRDELHKEIQRKLKLASPIVREIGRYRIAGAETQGRVLREMIENGQMKGWDDPRLVTLKALRRRGFVPEMFQELAKTVGLSKSSGQIDFAVLESVNRKLIDTRANRYFFVADPQKIEVKDAPQLTIEAPLHPSDKQRGTRTFKTEQRFYLPKADMQALKGKDTIRFMHLFNVSQKGNTLTYRSQEPDASLKTSFVHWLPADKANEKKLVKADIMMADATVVHGLAEAGIKKLKVGESVQFERFGFCRLDAKQKDRYTFWFTHP